MNKQILDLMVENKITDDVFDNFSLKNKIIVIKELIKSNEKNKFNHLMIKFISPDFFWEISKYLVKEKNYDFLKELICCYKKIENDKQYVNNLLFDFIEKDDLYFVNYLISKENASTESIVESEVSVLNECVKYDAIKCFDYFLNKGKPIQEFDDLVFFTILEEKKYHFIPLFINKDFKLNENIAKNFFRYGLKHNQKNISVKNLNNIIKNCEILIDNNTTLQNKLTIELLKKGNFIELEKVLKKGYSAIGEENEIMDCAINLEKNSVKFIKLLLDYGGYVSEEQLNKLNKENVNEINNYPRFSKLNEKLSKNLEFKKKIQSLKI